MFQGDEKKDVVVMNRGPREAWDSPEGLEWYELGRGVWLLLCWSETLEQGSRSQSQTWCVDR